MRSKVLLITDAGKDNAASNMASVNGLLVNVPDTIKDISSLPRVIYY